MIAGDRVIYGMLLEGGEIPSQNTVTPNPTEAGDEHQQADDVAATAYLLRGAAGLQGTEDFQLME